MKILAIESSALVASVAILDGEKITAEYCTDHKKTHSETLLPMIDEIVRMTETDLADIDAIAVSGGPGSFTGLRIGGTTAKGLGLALDKKIIHVPTIDAMAYNLPFASGIICPIMDARRNQVYTGLYKWEDGKLIKLLSQTAMDLGELLSLIQKNYNEKIIFLGDGVPVFKDEITRALGGAAAFAPANLNRQKASSVALLGGKMYERGEYISADDFVPDYLRQSQAEREYTEISEITEGDFAELLALENECFDDPWSETMLAGHFKNTCNGGLIARHNGKAVGYVLYQRVAGEGEIFTVGTAKDFRRAGIAKRLMSVLLEEEDLPIAERTDLWSLEVRASNAPAIALYSSVGFKPVRIRQDYYTSPPEDAICMTRER